MAIEIVDLPSYKMVIFQFAMLVYQRVPSAQFKQTQSSDPNINMVTQVVNQAPEAWVSFGYIINYIRILHDLPICWLSLLPFGKLT